MDEDEKGQDKNDAKYDSKETNSFFNMLRKDINKFIHKNKLNIIIVMVLVLCIALIIFFRSTVFDDIKLYSYYKLDNSPKLENYIKSNYKKANRNEQIKSAVNYIIKNKDKKGMDYIQELFNELPDIDYGDPGMPDNDYTLIKKAILKGFNDNNATFSSIDSVCDYYIGNDYDYKDDLIKMMNNYKNNSVDDCIIGKIKTFYNQKNFDEASNLAKEYKNDIQSNKMNKSKIPISDISKMADSLNQINDTNKKLKDKNDDKEKINKDISSVQNDFNKNQQDYNSKSSSIISLKFFVIKEADNNVYEIAPLEYESEDGLVPSMHHALLTTESCSFTTKGWATMNVYIDSSNVDVKLKEEFGSFDQSWIMYKEASSLRDELSKLNGNINDEKKTLTSDNAKLNSDNNDINKLSKQLQTADNEIKNILK